MIFPGLAPDQEEVVAWVGPGGPRDPRPPPPTPRERSGAGLGGTGTRPHESA